MSRPVSSTATSAPRCEVCRKELARSFSWFADRERWYEPRSGVWRFTGDCAVENYRIALYAGGHGFLDSATARFAWLTHLGRKPWFNSTDFSAMLARFRRAGRRRIADNGKPSRRAARHRREAE